MTTIHDISRWISDSDDDATHMIVVCDDFDHSDYPVYVKNHQDIRKVIKKYDGVNMQRIMEVYNLNMDIQKQLDQPRAFNY